MAIYKKKVSLGGAWFKGSEIQNGVKAKLVSETTSQPSTFLNKDGSPKTQEVAKIRIAGQSEALNISINRYSIDALVDAFGEDSVNWQGRELTIETEKSRVAGKAVTVAYLIPEGYVRTDDESGYPVIIKKDIFDQMDGKVSTDEPTINAEDIPF